MNSKLIVICLVAVLAVASVVEAHKKFYNGGGPQPIYGGGHQQERCVCDCAQPVLPNKPYYGSGGYHQQQPRPSGGGYGNAGSYAVAGSYGSGGGQASGGY